MKRTLLLKRESLTQLTSDELTALVGAAVTKQTCLGSLLHMHCPSAFTCPTE